MTWFSGNNLSRAYAWWADRWRTIVDAGEILGTAAGTFVGAVVGMPFFLIAAALEYWTRRKITAEMEELLTDDLWVLGAPAGHHWLYTPESKILTLARSDGEQVGELIWSYRDGHYVRWNYASKWLRQCEVSQGASMANANPADLMEICSAFLEWHGFTGPRSENGCTCEHCLRLGYIENGVIHPAAEDGEE